jgi:hypothetical protein
LISLYQKQDCIITLTVFYYFDIKTLCFVKTARGL